MSWLHALVQGIWVILPAYIANGAAPVFGGKRRMDFGKKFLGNDLLGAGKTWEGFTLAVASGTLMGLIQMLLWPYLQGPATSTGFTLPFLTPRAVFAVSLFAMIGDLIASFFKRRSGLERGRKTPLIDQLDFVLLSLLAANFFLSLSYASIALVIIITPFLHYLFNLIAYEIGLKEVPW
ncbi:MAG: CDP-2,3-bis-(O-geranylgeranyl)-sn-glycerol synthase [Candidatus Aenigmatarchaeota archaeon]